MKSYGKVDETWNDAKFQGMIEDALQMAREQKKVFAVGQDMDGTAVVALSKEDYPPIFACAATAWDDEAFQKGKIVLVDNVAYHEYSVEEMVPRVRGRADQGGGGVRRFAVPVGREVPDRRGGVVCAHVGGASRMSLHSGPDGQGSDSSTTVGEGSISGRGVVRGDQEWGVEHDPHTSVRWLPLHGPAHAANS